MLLPKFLISTLMNSTTAPERIPKISIHRSKPERTFSRVFISFLRDECAGSKELSALSSDPGFFKSGIRRAGEALRRMPE